MNTSDKETLFKLFERKIIAKYQDQYDLSEVDYISRDKSVIITCKYCGYRFKANPRWLLRDGHKCRCIGNARREDKRKSNELFISQCISIYGDRYDYTNTIYEIAHGFINVKCNKCGNTFRIKAFSHLQGHGCKCNQSPQITLDSFIERARKVHGNKYDYTNVIIKNIKSRIDIICHKHGSFKQIAQVHLTNKSGCPRCKSSKGENAVKLILDNNKIEYVTQKTFPGCKSKNLLRFDFYIPSLNMCSFAYS